MTKDELTKRLIVYFLGPVVIIVLGLAMVSKIRMALSRASDEQTVKNAQSFPTVDGTVKNFLTEQVRMPTGKLSSRYDYLVTVIYSYPVKEKMYESKQQKFLDHAFNFAPENIFILWDQKQLIYTLEEKQKLESDYQIGSHHAVWYDPNNPSNSFIDVFVKQ